MPSELSLSPKKPRSGGKLELSPTKPRSASGGKFSSRLIRTMLLLLGATIGVHHVMLSNHHFYDYAYQSVGEDQDITHQRLLQNLNPEDANLSLESLTNHVGHSSQLSEEERAQLLETIQKLSKEKQEQTAATSSSKSPYAYMFVIGGIHEGRPAYKGFLYDVLVAAHLLQQVGSTADVVLFTQMSPDSNLTQLPPEDLQQLSALDVKVTNLPKPSRESFAGLVFEKFRALQMTDYRRVIFLDADAIPLTNLDYLFHLSDPLHASTPTLLRPNLIMASRGEPCNAGLFMLKPEEGAWDELQQIIKRQREEGAKMDYPHFSYERGWGYDFAAEKDPWQGTVKYGYKWRFHAGHSDQGLLYYWTKFVKRDVSIIIQAHVQNWIDAGPNANMTVDGKPKPILQMTLGAEPLAQFSSPTPVAWQYECDDPNNKDLPVENRKHHCIVPYRDFAHYMGGNKPWMVPDPKKYIAGRETTKKYEAAITLWFKMLMEVNTKLNMGLDFDNWHEKHDIKEAPLGSMAKKSDFMTDHAATQN